ncbi:glutathione peroxidase [Magnetospira sp. QH-2]|uniref:glutathione peroxidase n=1 Tax=Magnetospira sp. (strain QH-2) TaxID=1288970 RepID=UPI0003E81BFE|nr:glutathione peroxidase [Magnetospira sp. QH-2]CCQ73564.1 Peroxidase. Putative glutathione peroxidase [Magnetospira sp. QH-2]
MTRLVPYITMALLMLGGLLFGLMANPALAANAHGFTFVSIDGDPLPLAKYKGKALLVVNTATECGNTHQLGDLQKLWETYKDKGLVLVGVPSDDFGQEPRDNKAIKDFCETNFSVDFPMTELTAIKGAKAHPFYKHAVAQLGDKSEPSWNFHKFLVGPDGKMVDYFGTGAQPLGGKLEQAVQAVLP